MTSYGCTRDWSAICAHWLEQDLQKITTEKYDMDEKKDCEITVLLIITRYAFRHRI